MKKLFKKYLNISPGDKSWHKLFRHPVILTLSGLAVLLLLVLGGYQLIFANSTETPASSAFIVIIRHDDQVQTVPSRQPTVGKLLSQAGVRLYKGDVVEPSLDTHINQDDFRINVYRAVPVKVVDGDDSTFFFSAAMTPRSIAEAADYELHAEDGVTAKPVTNFLKQGAIGEQVVIDRSVPVHLNLYGTSVTLRTHENTVADLLRSKGLRTVDSDQIVPDLDTPIKANQQIFVVRKGTKLQSEVEEIPMPIKEIKDPKLSYGTSAIRQYGAPGARVVTYRVNKKTGARKVIQDVVVKAPVKQVVVRGTAPVSGTLSDWLRELRLCESGGNYQTNTGNGFYGAYQFLDSTWDRLNTGYSRADLAPPSVQDRAIVTNTNRSSGGLAGQNPGCYRSTGISAFPPDS